MLGLRLLTGIPLAIAAVWFVLTKNSDSILYALIVIAAIAGWEWAALSKARITAMRVLYALSLSLSVWAVSQMGLVWLTRLNMVAVVFWILMIIYLSRVAHIRPTTQLSGIKLVLGFVVLIPSISAMWMLHRFNPEWLLFGMSLVWVADIGAYFSGRRFGKVKLAPVLSPGKTREGFYGALALTLVYSLAATTLYFKLGTTAVLQTLALTFVVTVFSVAGDLFESLLKRQVGVKDSGRILPGHGGVLDRVDSLTATMSLFSIATIYIYHLDLFLI